jgi:hypothetical protein
LAAPPKSSVAAHPGAAPPIAAPVHAPAPRRLAALPPQHEAPPAPGAHDTPQIRVVRGRPGFAKAAPPPAAPQQIAPPPPVRLVAVPKADTPAITVMRGGPRLRSAPAGILPVPHQPAVSVFRRTRPKAAGLAGLAPPGPLVLRLHD